MKLVEVLAESGHIDTILRLARQNGAQDHWLAPENKDGRQPVRLLVALDNMQDVLDALQSRLKTSETARIIIYPVEATLPLLQSFLNLLTGLRRIDLKGMPASLLPPSALWDIGIRQSEQ